MNLDFHAFCMALKLPPCFRLALKPRARSEHFEVSFSIACSEKAGFGSRSFVSEQEVF